MRKLMVQTAGAALAIGFVVIHVALSAADPAERKIDPTFLHKYVPDVQPSESDITTSSCHYRAIFGEGDPASTPGVVRGVSRFGEITLEPGGACKAISYPAEEQVYVVTDGQPQLHYGADVTALKAHDFMYLPASVDHYLANASGQPAARVFLMGFKIEPNTPPPPSLMIANFDTIRKQILSSHPDSVTYQLMMGNVKSKRDKLAAAHLLTSLYVMEFQPGGTNFPHHHESEEEIYFLMDGHGEMVAGGGMDGIEGRHPAKPGDAYFFRENCTVGFYNSKDGEAHILAVRSVYPRPAYPTYVK